MSLQVSIDWHKYQIHMATNFAKRVAVPRLFVLEPRNLLLCFEGSASNHPNDNVWILTSVNPNMLCFPNIKFFKQSEKGG
jgi:hypothetical protein